MKHSYRSDLLGKTGTFYVNYVSSSAREMIYIYIYIERF